MVRTAARGLKRVFRGLLKLIIKHQDQPRTIRLRGRWVTFDPRQWNADMDATVNVGLGAGTRERDMMAMQAILGLQEKLLSSIGTEDNPYVTPTNLSNAIGKFVEAVGLPSNDMFFSKPTAEQLAKLAAPKPPAPDPAMEKMKMEMQARQQKQQMDFQLEQQKLAQEAQLERERIAQNGELKRFQIEQELQLKRQQNVAQALSSAPLAPVHVGGMPG
jgi:hypothetical protein